MNTRLHLGLIVVGLLALAATASGQVTIFTASLDGAQVPAATSGSGSATMSFNSTTGDWSLSGSFTGLTGTASLLHIHGPAAPGSNAGVVKGLDFVAGAGTTSGTFAGNSSTFGTFTTAQGNDLLSGFYYINIHTSAFGSGEIRGQLMAVPEPTTFALMVVAGVLGLGIKVFRRGAFRGRPVDARRS